MSTEYIDYPTGNTLYGKPKPLVASPWSGDVINLFENGTTGEYSGVFSTGIYTIFLQSGASPSSGDTKLGGYDLRVTSVNLQAGSITSGTFDNSTAFPIVKIDDGATEIVRGTVSVSGEVTLADGSITASKFDNATAFPVRQSDSGNSSIFRTSDSINLSGAVISGATVNVDYTLVIPAASLPRVTSRHLSLPRNTKWNFNVSGIGAEANEFYFTIKTNKSILEDNQSELQVNTSGVTYLDATYVGVASGHLTYSSGNSGTINISIEPEVTSLVTPGTYAWDIKGIDGADETTIRSYGSFEVSETVTRRIG